MNKILELDRANLTLLVQPGVTCLQVADAAGAAKLFYPPDPGSMKISTIGGNVAENAGGLRGLKYGVTRNYVMGLEVVFCPTAKFFGPGNKCVKDVAGYSLKDLFIGSEGTARRHHKNFASLDSKTRRAQNAHGNFRANGCRPPKRFPPSSPRRLFPARSNFSTAPPSVASKTTPTKSACPWIAKLPAADGKRRPSCRRCRRSRRHGAHLPRAWPPQPVRVARDDAEGAQLASARRSAFSALARVAPTTILEDATVPCSALAGLIRFIDGARQKI